MICRVVNGMVMVKSVVLPDDGRFWLFKWLTFIIMISVLDHWWSENGTITKPDTLQIKLFMNLVK